MSGSRRLTDALRRRRGAWALLGAAGLLVSTLAVALALSRSPPPAPPGSAEARAATPQDDDVPDPAPPPGEVVPGTKGRVPTEAPGTVVLGDQLLVKFREGTPKGVAAAVLAKAGADPKGRVERTGTRIVGIPPARHDAALDILAASPAVAYAESDVVLNQLDTVPNDPRWADEWGARKVSAPRAWDNARGSESLVIAVLDTGVDFGQADLRGAAVPGYDLVNNDSDPADDQGHGTATAGVVAARTNNALGLAGVCWTCSLMSVKVLDSSGFGSTSTIARGIVWAADHGAHVINMSLGGPSGTQTLADAVAYAAGEGVLLVAAAGNSGGSAPFYPAAYADVIAVAGTDSSDQRYSWSNYGSWVQVAAPGCNVAPLRGGGYGTFCGTSSATPVVAGLAALALSAKPSATQAEVAQAIESAASPIGAAVEYGRVDAPGTLAALGADDASLPPTTTSATFKSYLGPSVGKRVYRRSVGAGRVAAKLSFTHAPGLTLSIVDADGVAVRRVSGASPLSAAATVAAGTFRFVVQGSVGRKAPFTLRVSYPVP